MKQFDIRDIIQKQLYYYQWLRLSNNLKDSLYKPLDSEISRTLHNATLELFAWTIQS